MKSPTPRIRRFDSPFSKDQEKWIVKRSAFLSPTELRRAFVKHFLGYENHRKAPDRNAFSRLVERFDETGGVTGKGQTEEQRRTSITAENIARVEEYFGDNEKNSIRTAVEGVSLHQSQSPHGSQQSRSFDFCSLAAGTTRGIRTKDHLFGRKVVLSPRCTELSDRQNLGRMESRRGSGLQIAR